MLVGFVEVKAPGKGADPRRFKGHDKEQWEKLHSLPNLIYTDGNAFSLWQEGELVGPMIRLVDDVLRRHFGRGAGLASPDVTLADPAAGTGTFLLGVLRRIAADVEADQGAGAVPQAIEAAIGPASHWWWDRTVLWHQVLSPAAAPVAGGAEPATC